MDDLCLLIGAFSAFILNVIIDMFGFMSVILLFVFYVSWIFVVGIVSLFLPYQLFSC